MTKRVSILIGCCLVVGCSTYREPILQAVNEQDYDRIQGILRTDPTMVNSQSAKFGTSPLHVATSGVRRDPKAEKEDDKIVEFLVGHGGNVNALDSRGWTPLACAAFSGHLQQMKILIDHGADVNASGNSGSTPLAEAAWMGQEDAVKLLIEHGADVKKCGPSGLTPLHWAALGECQNQWMLMGSAKEGRFHNPFGVIARLLLERGADPKARDAGGQTVFDINRDSHIDGVRSAIWKGNAEPPPNKPSEATR